MTYGETPRPDGTAVRCLIALHPAGRKSRGSVCLCHSFGTGVTFLLGGFFLLMLTVGPGPTYGVGQA